jgi:hypothetical protein
MEQIINAATENWFWSVIVAASVLWIISSTIESVLKSATRERSRREIAAYIAEGSMTAEEGERLMNAGKRKGCC